MPQAERQVVLVDTRPKLPARFEVLELIGKGGMGTVYKVRDTDLDVVLAVKVMKPDLAEDKQAVKRFEKEARMAQDLTHANIGPVYGHDVDESGVPYLTMEYLEGKSLQDILAEKGSLSEQQAMDLFIDVSEALRYAHTKNVIHRDIKPSNVLFAHKSDGTLTPKLIDFGIAHILPGASGNRQTQNLSQSGDVFGTPTYMSPEQCMGFRLDARSDIYSLGCLMYEVLTGAPPFKAENPIQLVVKQINEEVASWSGTEAGKAYPALEGVVMRCLEKDNRERYQSVDELMADLRLCAQGKQPVPFKRSQRTQSIHSAAQVAKVLLEFLLIAAYALSMTFVSAWFLLLCLVPLAPIAVFFLIKQATASGAQDTGLKQWQLLSQVSWTVACLTAIPLAAAFFGVFESMAFGMQFAILALFLLHWLALLSTFAGQAGNLFFSEAVKLPAVRIFKPFAATLILALLVTTPLVTPARFSNLAESAPVALPALQAACAQVNVLLNRSDAPSRVALAEHHVTNGDKQNALDLCTEALAIQPPSASTYAACAQVYASVGETDRAFELLDKALTLQPSSNLAYQIRGDIYSNTGKYAHAIDDYDKAIDLRPDQSGSVYSNRAAAKVRIRNFRGAIDDLTSAIEIRNVQSDRDLLARAILYEKIGEIDKALADYRQVIDKNTNMLSTAGSAGSPVRGLMPAGPESSALRLRRAYAYIKIGNQSAGANDLKRITTGKDALLQDFQKRSGLSPDWTPLAKRVGVNDV